MSLTVFTSKWFFATSPPAQSLGGAVGWNCCQVSDCVQNKETWL
jgi:hypothetical protein